MCWFSQYYAYCMSMDTEETKRDRPSPQQTWARLVPQPRASRSLGRWSVAQPEKCEAG